MTRFEQEINGTLGEYWQREAVKELAKVAEDIKNKQITIDENGVARNCIGRVLMDDMAEKVSYVSPKIDIKATRQARDKEVSETLKEIRKTYQEPTQEELMEMRSVFGIGVRIIDVVTQKEYIL